ncbi:MAG: hypothetical protein ACKESB_02825 [Candidatus Hodgkinia cicadicola]
MEDVRPDVGVSGTVAGLRVLKEGEEWREMRRGTKAEGVGVREAEEWEKTHTLHTHTPLSLSTPPPLHVIPHYLYSVYHLCSPSLATSMLVNRVANAVYAPNGTSYVHSNVSFNSQD